MVSLKYRNSRKIIESLPPMFTNKDALMLTDIKPEQIRVYLHRWVKDGYLIPFGGRTGIYFKGPDEKDKYYTAAIQKAYPGAVLSGANVLHDAGATTQIPRIYDIAIPTRSKYPKITDVAVHTRGKKWYDLIVDKKYFDNSGDIPALLPEFALADMLKYKDGWVPDPDDIDPEEMNRNFFVQACRDLKIEETTIEPFLNDGPRM